MGFEGQVYHFVNVFWFQENGFLMLWPNICFLTARYFFLQLEKTSRCKERKSCGKKKNVLPYRVLQSFRNHFCGNGCCAVEGQRTLRRGEGLWDAFQVGVKRKGMVGCKTHLNGRKLILRISVSKKRDFLFFGGGVFWFSIRFKVWWQR